jgi:hypothetical protein
VHGDRLRLQSGVLYEAQLQLRTARRRRKAFVEWGRWWWLPMLTSAIASAGAVAFSYPLASLRYAATIHGA